MIPTFVVLIIADDKGNKDKVLFDSIGQAKAYFSYIMKRNPNATSIELRRLKDNELLGIWR